MKNANPDERSFMTRWTWYEYKYLPLLKGWERDARILELGCGPGKMLAFLQSQGFKNVKGIDISEEQVQIARDRGVNATKVDVFDYLLTMDGQIDVIIAIDFIEHFTRQEMLPLVAAIHKALITSGVLILQTPNGKGMFSRQVIYGDLTHMTIFTPESLQQLLRLHGFGEFLFLETGPVPCNLRGYVRLAFWSFIKRVANLVRQIEAEKSQEIWTECMICFSRKI
jgi:2-polyprenyl-3-methyl-5-hydroxy-6-metoxy-1,4-benzoquinol methylase